MVMLLRLINLLGAIISIALLVVTYFYYDWIRDLRIEQSLYGNQLFINLISNFTIEAGIWTVILIILMMIIQLVNIVNPLNYRHRTINILGVILSLFMIIWNVIMMINPSHISFDEVAPAWFGFAFIAFFMFLFEFYQRTKFKSQSQTISSTEILDDI
jgi:DMSO/TMAO reductase YedYZ heme-binding membrane subunit